MLQSNYSNLQNEFKEKENDIESSNEYIFQLEQYRLSSEKERKTTLENMAVYQDNNVILKQYLSEEKEKSNELLDTITELQQSNIMLKEQMESETLEIENQQHRYIQMNQHHEDLINEMNNESSAIILKVKKQMNLLKTKSQKENKELKDTIATLRQTNQINETKNNTLHNEQASTTRTIQRLQNELLEQTTLYESTNIELETQSNLLIEKEEEFNEKERKHTLEYDGMQQQLLLSQQELEHERIRHQKQTTSIAETHASTLNTQKQESIRINNNKLTTMESALKQSETFQHLLNASLQTARSEILEMEKKFISTKTVNVEIQTKLNNVEKEMKEQTKQLQAYMISTTEQKKKIVELETKNTATLRSKTDLQTTNEMQRTALENQIHVLQNELELVSF